MASLLATSIFAGTAGFFFLSTYALFGGLFLKPTDIAILDMLTNDTHYKYFILFLVPTTAYFVIARWTGWQYFVSS